MVCKNEGGGEGGGAESIISVIYERDEWIGTIIMKLLQSSCPRTLRWAKLLY